VASGVFVSNHQIKRRIDMKFDLENAFKTLGWPLGLITVFSSVLLLFGVQLDTVLAIAGSMLGAKAPRARRLRREKETPEMESLSYLSGREDLRAASDLLHPMQAR
jgi:hypothetical protein